MPVDDKTAVRATAVIVLILLAVTGLRGYLPELGRTGQPDEPSEAGSGSLVALVVMLTVSMTVIVIAVLAQPARRPAAPAEGAPRRELRAPGTAMRWRPLLFAAAALLLWSLVILLLMRWVPAVTVDDAAGTSAPSGAEGRGDPERAQPADHGDAPVVLAVLTGVTVALIVTSAATTLLGRRRAPAVPEQSADPGDAAPAPVLDLARATERGLAEVGDLSRDPRQAIIACYLAMERELEKSPGTVPQDSDTPAEVLARAVQRRVLPPDSATRLVELFEEARFSPHVMDESHRCDAVAALRLVQSELR